MNKIRLSKSSIDKEDIKYVSRVLKLEYLGMGEEVKKFESEIKSFLKTKNYVICVNSGTAALHLSIQALKIGIGDEVLVPSITYLSTFQAISATGAKPIPCDVSYDRVFIDLQDAFKKLTNKTKAIIPVHYASNSIGIEEVYLFAKKYNLRVIEDAAHSFGSETNGKKINDKADIICFSFDGIKNITSGEGGAIVTRNKKLAELIQDARLLGVENDTKKRYSGLRSWYFDVHYQGWRYHMSNIMAALGRSQLKKFDKFAKKRKKIVNLYINELKIISQIQILNFNYCDLVSHIFPIKIIDGSRDELRKFLLKHDIESGYHYQPNHQLSLYLSNNKLPNTELLAKELISLPLHTSLKTLEQKKVLKLIKSFYSQ